MPTRFLPSHGETYSVTSPDEAIRINLRGFLLDNYYNILDSLYSKIAPLCEKVEFRKPPAGSLKDTLCNNVTRFFS